MAHFSTDVLNILAAIGSAFGIYQAHVWLHAICDRAILLVGILPFGDVVDEQHPAVKIEDLGRRQHAVEFVFEPREYFAVRGEFRDSFEALQSDEYRYSTRRYARTAHGEYVLPIILSNNGRARFGGYGLTITVSERLDVSDPAVSGPRIRIVDLVTEGAEVASVFADPRTFQGAKIIHRATDSRIYDIYARMRLTGNLTVLTGELEPKLYELIYLKVRVPGDITQFCVFFAFDSPHNLWGVQKYCQLVTIV